jgi:hypothetical protein
MHHMKKFLLVLFLSFFSLEIFAQQFSLLNTGTLYDAFENPSQRAFIPDTSKMYAFNFFIPNVNANLFLSGNAQATLKSRVFLDRYNSSALAIDPTKFNHVTENVNAYVFMFKWFSSLKGDVEMGVSWQIKSDGKALLTDASVASLNGPGAFNDGQDYSNILNSHYYYQTYHQISYTYREKINKQLQVGFKFSVLAGIEYQKLNINSSSAVFDKAADSALVALQGRYYAGYIPGHFTAHDYLPTFRSPGASISVGATYHTEDNVILQGNIKDLGFIDWSSRSRSYDFDGTTTIYGLSSPEREDSVYNKVNKLIHARGGVIGSFTTPIDGVAELSASKSFWVDDDRQFKYSPTLVVSKELFYQGFTAGFVNPIQYDKYVLTLTPSYDDLKAFNLGVQFMLKTPNWEFYIGSDRITQTAALTGDMLNKNSPNVTMNSAYSGMSIFLGFSLKLGPTVEHPMNASSIPTGEKGFLGRLWGRLFKTYN